MLLSEETQRAIDARLEARAALLGRISSGDLALATVLDDRSSDAYRDVRVLAVLDAVDGVGKVVVRRTLDAHGIDEATLLGDLTDLHADVLRREFR